MPMHMSTRGRYGVRLMVALALNYGNGITLLRDVSRREGISEKYLGQIIIPLKNAGLVTLPAGLARGLRPGPAAGGGHRQGRGGGDRRARSPPCSASTTRKPAPGRPPAWPRRVWKKLSEDIERSLSTFTLGALARQARELATTDASYEI